PIPLAVILCLLLARLGQALRLRPPWSIALLVAWVGLTALAYGRSSWRIDHFTAARDITTQVVQSIQQAIDQAPPREPVYIVNQSLGPVVVTNQFAGWAGLFTIYCPEDTGRPVYFIEKAPALRALAPPGSRLAKVLVAAPPSS